MNATRSERRRSAWLRRGAACAIALSALVAGLSAIERDPTAVALEPERWVESHRSSLPTTLAELSAYPVRYRRSILAALPSAKRLQIVRDDIRDKLVQRRDLSEAQRSYLDNLARRLDAAVSGSATIDTSLVAATAECRLQKELFPDKETRARFGDGLLGGSTTPSYSAEALALRTIELARAVAVAVMPAVHARQFKVCNCNQQYEVCDCPGVSCRDDPCDDPGANLCHKPWIGCLFTDPQECDGWCPNE